jgi:hypothetical protein
LRHGLKMAKGVSIVNLGGSHQPWLQVRLA